MIVFKSNQKLSNEDWCRWRNYIEKCNEQEKPILLPEFIDLLTTEEGEEVEYEEE